MCRSKSSLKSCIGRTCNLGRCLILVCCICSCIHRCRDDSRLFVVCEVRPSNQVCCCMGCMLCNIFRSWLDVVDRLNCRILHILCNWFVCNQCSDILSCCGDTGRGCGRDGFCRIHSLFSCRDHCDWWWCGSRLDSALGKSKTEILRLEQRCWNDTDILVGHLDLCITAHEICSLWLGKHTLTSLVAYNVKVIL